MKRKDYYSGRGGAALPPRMPATGSPAPGGHGPWRAGGPPDAPTGPAGGRDGGPALPSQIPRLKDDLLVALQRSHLRGVLRVGQKAVPLPLWLLQPGSRPRQAQGPSWGASLGWPTPYLPGPGVLLCQTRNALCGASGLKCVFLSPGNHQTMRCTCVSDKGAPPPPPGSSHSGGPGPGPPAAGRAGRPPQTTGERVRARPARKAAPAPGPAADASAARTRRSPGGLAGLSGHGRPCVTKASEEQPRKGGRTGKPPPRGRGGADSPPRSVGRSEKRHAASAARREEGREGGRPGSQARIPPEGHPDPRGAAAPPRPEAAGLTSPPGPTHPAT